MKNTAGLKELAHRIRENVLEMTYASGVNGGHLGGAFSSAEILAVLYGKILNWNVNNMTDPGRDRFILSKGHIAIGHYAVLAEVGIISKEEMMSFEKDTSFYQTHEKEDISRGIEFSGGSLGYGASFGVGTALMARKRNMSYKTYVLTGEGECNEGIVWEAMMSAVQYGLDNITFIIDVNKQQLDGMTVDIMPIRDIETVCKGFGCEVISIDGNDVDEVYNALRMEVFEKPKVIIANTIKAKGISSAEGKTGTHHIRLTAEVYNQYKNELELCK